MNRSEKIFLFVFILLHSCDCGFIDLGFCVLAGNITCPDPYINFYLYTNENKDEPQKVTADKDGILKSNFKPENETKIIIHGFASGIHFELQEIKNAYLSKGKYNVWMVDWEKVAAGPCFPVIVSTLNYIGTCVAQFVNHLREVISAPSMQSLHVIGFSLGAHAAAYTAFHLEPFKLPRITGLDPSFALFVKTVNRKLSKEDAQFVDVVHTDAMGPGRALNCGHVDFFMNGGSSQPGCRNKNMFETIKCNHLRAITYFAESITSEKGFWGWPCPSFFHYLFNKCPPQTPTLLMGEYCDRNATGCYIVTTASTSPFAIGKNFSHAN